MKKNNFIKWLTIDIIAIAIVFAGIIFSLYIWVIPSVLNSDLAQKEITKVLTQATGAEVIIDKPLLNTHFSPNVEFSINKILLKKENKNYLDIENFKTQLGLGAILFKKIKIKEVRANKIFVDVNDLISLFVKQPQKKEQKSDWKIDIIDSLLDIKYLKIYYTFKNNVKTDITGKNIQIKDTTDDTKFVHFDITTILSRQDYILNIAFNDNNRIFVKDSTLWVKDFFININKSSIKLNAKITDKKYNLNIASGQFDVKDVIIFLRQSTIPYVESTLALFKDIKGKFNFNITLSDNDRYGDIIINKSTLKLVPMQDMPMSLKRGKIHITKNNIILSDFEGFYGIRSINAMKFNGTVKDYLKTMDTNLVADAIVTNDFMKKYLTPMIGYPIELVGKADTRLKIQYLNGKTNLLWLFRITPKDDLLIGGEPLSTYKLERVLSTQMEIEKTILNIKKLEYFVTVPNTQNDHRRLLSLDGKIDFSNGIDFREMGFDISEPLPSEFLNMVTRKPFFKGGNILGNLHIVQGPKGIKLFGKLNLNKIRIPSQRLTIKNAVLKTDFNKIKIISSGRYRRTKFNVTSEFNNNISFPVVINDLQLAIEKMNIDKILKSFNKQGEQISTPINNDVTDDDDVNTFDLANIIIKNCEFKLNSGSYKEINFGNIQACMTLDKNSVLKLDSNRFDFAEGHTSCHCLCDLKKHKYNIRLGAKNINSDIVAKSLLNLSKEISGKASGIIDLHTDESLKMNGQIKFVIKDGVISKIGLVEYILKMAAIFRNPLAMINPMTFVDLVNIPDGSFARISGSLDIKNNVIESMNIKSASEQLSAYVTGSYDLEKKDASIKIYTRLTNKNKGLYGVLRKISLGTLANRVTDKKDYSYYEADLKELPEINAKDKDCQVFLTTVEGDIEHNNFLSSLRRVK